MNIVDSLTPRPGLRVLVTAGANGIGARITAGFVEAEGKVHISDVDAAAVAASTGGAVSGTVADASKEADTQRVFDEARDAMGGIDVVVANAGVAGPTSTVGEIGADDWDQTVDVNLRGAYLAARCGAADLIANKGSFIAMSSAAGRLGFAYRTPYAAAKWGIVGFVKSLAAELGPQGVRANAIQPGIVEGPRIDRVISARAEELGISFDEMKEQNLAKVSLRRMVSPDDIAAMCLFLCAPGGSNISGQAISVCGNVEAL